MKNTYHVIITFVLLLVFSGCDSFVELYPLDQANVENSLITPGDANLAVMGVYDALQSGNYARHMALMSEVISDNATGQPTRIADAGRLALRELEYFQMTDENEYCQDRWSALYQGIARANLLLGRIDNIEFTDETLKDQYIGEAKFLRGMFYFDLVRFFGGVPVSLTAIESTDEAFSLGRLSETEVYDVVIADLKEASSLLPVSYGSADVGRATQGAAKALLAKVYLTNGNPELALTLLQELTGSTYSYKLLDTYAGVFDTDNTSESIFEVQYTSSDPNEGNPYPQFFLTNDATAGEDIYGSGYLGTAGQGECLPTDDMWEAYETNDIRREYTILKYYSKQEAADVNVVYKYRGVPTSAYNSEDNIIVLRYADVLLMIAEAINEISNGPTSEAYDAVDKIRIRAGLPVLSRDLDYDSFKEKLLHERRVELAFENHRWFDLKRFGMALSVLSEKGYDIQSYHLLYPIPRKEVLINPENIQQNPGY